MHEADVSETLVTTYQTWGHYATSRKVAASRPDEVNGFFSIHLILPSALGLGFDSASNRNEYQKQKNIISGE
jgi:hypothetical protein